MAGEWIPIRIDLFDCPQVVRILSEICPDCVRDSSERVRRTSEVVGALVRMWSLFDRYTDDGELKGYSEKLLDQVVGIDGFSRAAALVGWLEVLPNGLKMPEFSRYLSTSAKARLKDAQRKRDERAASESCPKNVRTNPDRNRTTEQKNTEEKKDNANPPISPKGERLKFDASKVSLPIQTEAFKEAWNLWCQHRTEIKKPLKPTSCDQQLKQLADWGEARAIAAIRYTVAKGWQGIQEPDVTKRNGKPYNPEVGDIF